MQVASKFRCNSAIFRAGAAVFGGDADIFRVTAALRDPRGASGPGELGSMLGSWGMLGRGT
eukprot:2114732-Rhodomonas_salina.1